MGATYTTNPRLLLPPSTADMLRAWHAARGRGFGSASLMATPVLPEAGGLLDQAALNLDAFDVMDAAQAALTPRRKDASA